VKGDQNSAQATEASQPTRELAPEMLKEDSKAA
jgi:hypothetical protein